MLMIMIIFIIFYYYYYQRQLLALFRLWGTLRGEQWSEKSCIEFPPTGGVRHLWSWQDFEFWVFFFSEWGYRNYDLNLSFGKNQMMIPPTGGVRRLWSWRNFVFYNLIFEFFQCNIINWDNRNANLNLWLVKKNQKM